MVHFRQLLMLTLPLVSAAALASAAQSGATCGDRFAALYAKSWKTLSQDTMQGLRIFAFGSPLPRLKSSADAAWLEKAGELLQSTAVPITKALVPFPLPRDLGRGEVYRLFRKVWKNPEVALDLSEKRLLESRGLTQDLQDFRNLLRENPRAVVTRKALEASAATAVAAGSAAALVQLAQESEAGVVPSAEFLNHETYRLGQWQVQLLSETVPFPHLAFRMGDRVYSYGVSHMTVGNIVQYLEEKKFAELARENSPMKETPVEEKAGSFEAGMARASAATGFDRLPRSVHVVTLNLKPEEYRALKSHLEDQTGKRYHNVTFVNDCASMLVRALEKTTALRLPRIIDASPGQVVLAFSLLRAGGSDRVDSVRLVAVEEPQASAAHLLRNFYIHAIENKIFVAGFLINQGWRAWIDATFSEEQLQSHDPEVRQVIEETWREETAAFMEAHSEMLAVADAWKRFREAERGSQDAVRVATRLRDLFEFAAEKLDRREARRESNALEDFKQKTLARYRREWIRSERARIEQEVLPLLRAAN